MTHVIVISTDRKTAADVAECGGLRATSSRFCAARKLARLMVENGAENGPVEARGADGELRYTVKSLHAFAKFTLTENPSIHKIGWVANPLFAKHAEYAA